MVKKSSSNVIYFCPKFNRTRAMLLYCANVISLHIIQESSSDAMLFVALDLGFVWNSDIDIKLNSRFSLKKFLQFFFQSK